MSQVRCRIAISEGRYERTPTRATVSSILRWVFSDSLDDLEFEDPEGDSALVADAVVLLKSRYRRWGHNEVVRDQIVTALINSLRPEYESQVEVEIAYQPEDDFVGDLEHESDPWIGVERVWR